MRKKLTPIPKLVKKLDDVFQMCIRYRDDFTCITCGKKFPKGERKEFHAGHFISRGNYATRWDEENVAGQCASCNLKQSLADVETITKFSNELKKRYGESVMDRLFAKKHTTFKLSRPWLEEQIDFYTKSLKEYENGTNNINHKSR